MSSVPEKHTREPLGRYVTRSVSLCQSSGKPARGAIWPFHTGNQLAISTAVPVRWRRMCVERGYFSARLAMTASAI
jgi:hypothetical protein